MHRSLIPGPTDFITFIVCGDVDYKESDPSTFMKLTSTEAKELLGWLGIDRFTNDFGFLELSDLRAKCMRRLWPIPRNTDPAKGARPVGYLKGKTEEMLKLVERATTVLCAEGQGILYS